MMIMTKFFNHLLCVRTHSKHFMCINLHALQSKPIRKVLFLSPFLIEEN